MELGLFWTNKYTKGIDYLKVVEGISGTESSFHIVYTLAKFVQESLKPTKPKEEIEAFETLSELISNKVYYFFFFESLKLRLGKSSESETFFIPYRFSM